MVLLRVLIGLIGSCENKGQKMYCLYCGNCCKNMSPLDVGKECSRLKKINNFYFCNNYNDRPQECIDHKFVNEVCPIGMDTLGLKEPFLIRERILEGMQKIEGLIRC